MKKILVVCSLVALLFVSYIPKSHAVSFGESALTVGIATVAGGILGLSTLPFYPEMSSHTENIYYGSAIGAVVGVLICAYAGFTEGSASENAEADQAAIFPMRSKKNLESFTASAHGINKADIQLGGRFASNSLQPHTSDTILAWTPLLQVRW